MTIRLCDAQTGFGGLPVGEAEIVPLDGLLDEMARLPIERALVRTMPDDQARDVPAENQTLFDAAAAHEGLVPCPVLVPNTADDFAPEEEQVADAIDHDAGAAWIRPPKDNWLLTDWACGRLLGAMEDRRLSAFCIERDVTLEQVGDIARRHPKLPIIIGGLAYRTQRTILPLLATFDNVHVALGFRLAPEGCVRQLVDKAGADRLLFGTGFPVSEAMMAVTQLMYADIPDNDKAKIGAGNFERLMEGIVK